MINRRDFLKGASGLLPGLRGALYRVVVLTILVVWILINYLPCAFAQSNLSGTSDELRLIIAQQNVGDTDANDRAFWNSVKDSKNPDELRAYLQQFPTGVFAPLARTHLKAIVSTITGYREISRDGRFIAYDNGTVLDTVTNLMWAAKDNGKDIEWADAKSYCEHYTGGGYTGWRMPTQDELAGLYDNTKIYKSTCEYDVHLTELIRLSCSWVWAFAIRSKGLTYAILGDRAADFNFYDGQYDWHNPERYYFRALPVRSAK
jgi:hypothetical protein